MISTDLNACKPGHALVLTSGGVDSTTCLALAVERFGTDQVVAASVDYGQRHSRELKSARAVAEYYGVKLHLLGLSDIFSASNSALIASSDKKPWHGSYASQSTGDEGSEIVNTYVPFRNGLMLSACASLAMSLFPGEVCALYFGAHADDVVGDVYPDCSESFVASIGKAISIGTYGRVVLEVPFLGKAKAQVVSCGLQLGVPYELTWSCYEGGDVACGTCGTCIDRLQAFSACGALDPIAYAADRL